MASEAPPATPEKPTQVAAPETPQPAEGTPAPVPTEALQVATDAANAAAVANLAAPTTAVPAQGAAAWSPGGSHGNGSPGKKVRPDGPAKQALDLKYERLSGKIESYDAASGFGYVTSHLFPEKVLFRQDRIMPEFQQHLFQPFDAVEFDVQADDHARAHAVMLKPFVNRTPHHCIGQRHRGYVRRCAERWGFLNAAAFDGDLFVHRDNLLLVPGQAVDGQPPLRTGQPVAFDVAEDDRRRAVARQITTDALPRSGDMIGNRLTGQVRSFQGAWGFIISDSFAGDLFVHRDSFTVKDPAINVGMLVAFNVERDQRRKGTKDRLVARQVEILGGQDPMAAQAMMPLQMNPAAMQQPYPGMDPSMYGGALGPQAANFAPSMAQMYYPQMSPEGMPYSQPYANPYAPSPYMQQPMMPPQPQQPYMPQVLPQQPYQLPPQPQMQLRPPLPQAQPNAYLPAGVAPAIEVPPAQGGLVQQLPLPKASEAPQGAVPGPDGQQGLLHITMHDWEPDQAGQLWVTKGTLVNVSYRAAHGWVYAGTAQPGQETTDPASEGWLPQAVVKRVSLCRVAMDWPAEGSGTLGVAKGEVIAVSKEAERGWVYGERIGPRQPDMPADGWLPKKVLDYLQS